MDNQNLYFRLKTVERISIDFQGNQINKTIFFREVDRLSLIIKNKKNARVLWIGPNHPKLIALFVSCCQTESVLFIQKEKCAEFFNKVRPHFIINATAEASIHLHDLEKLEGHLCLSSSGSSGKSKLAIVDQKALLANAEVSAKIHGLTKDSKILASSSLAHSGGWNIHLLSGLISASHITLLSHYEAYSWADEITKTQFTHAHLAPGQVHALVKIKKWNDLDLNSFQLISVGSDVFPKKNYLKLEQKNKNILKIYGLTEYGPVALTSKGNSDPLCLGFVTPGTAARLGNQDQILLQGPALFSQYFDHNTSISEGFLNTQDLAISKDNQYYYRGRMKDTLSFQNKTIYPVEIEQLVLNEFSDSLDEFCFFNNDNVYSFLYTLAKKDKEDKFSENNLISHINKLIEGVFNFTVSRVPKLPRNANGKIMRRPYEIHS